MSVRASSKKTVLELFKTLDSITLELVYNPDGFALYDNGEESARIKALAPAVLSIDDTEATDEVSSDAAVHAYYQKAVNKKKSKKIGFHGWLTNTLLSNAGQLLPRQSLQY